MNEIEFLSDKLINKIAAGEVLESPASAVKELVENSIDAGARKIDIFIKGGGKVEITVSDDGHGISKLDLEKAISRHATSKLNTQTLNGIKTMGFRGEALSSIASVSDFTLKTNQNSSSSGYEIKAISGEIKYIKPVSQKKGTYVKLRNLFFSTPARLKFLKSENYESLRIKKLIQRFALVNYNIQFNLYINNKKVIKTIPILNKNIQFLNRVREVLGDEFVENSIELNCTENKLTLFGLLGVPTFNHSNSSNQFIFVNNRIVTDKSLNIIFKVAYRDLISHQRFPQLLVNIICPLDWVDVNVHPMKNEVRFLDTNYIKSFVIGSIKNSLKMIGHQNSNLVSTKLINKITKNSKIQNSLILKKNDDHSNRILKKDFDNNEKYSHDSKFKIDETKKNLQPLGFAKSQFHENYIISQTEKGIIIIDQHAAHERIVYEQMKEDFYKNKIKSQILLIPVIINVEKLVISDVEKKFRLLEKYGLKIEIFGTSSVVVREVPSIISNCDVEKLFKELINEIINDENFDTIEAEINKICSTMACHGSIRSGRVLQVDEMNDLLRKIEQTDFSGQCNHGRPTYVELKLDEIEKLFGRK